MLAEKMFREVTTGVFALRFPASNWVCMDREPTPEDASYSPDELQIWRP